MNKWARTPLNSIETIVDRLIKGFTKSENRCFIHMPGVDAPEWKEEVTSQFRRQVSNAGTYKAPWKDWIYIDLTGTTFSGHSTKTTLGNTLRSLCYSYLYLSKIGINRAWDSDRCFVIASGDDVVIWIEPESADALVREIRALTTRTTDA